MEYFPSNLLHLWGAHQTRSFLAAKQSEASTGIESLGWDPQGMTAAQGSRCVVRGHTPTKCQGRLLGSPDFWKLGPRESDMCLLLPTVSLCNIEGSNPLVYGTGCGLLGSLSAFLSSKVHVLETSGRISEDIDDVGRWAIDTRQMGLDEAIKVGHL